MATTRFAHRSATFLLYAAAQFLVLTTIAMRVYSGGSWANPWGTGYDFWDSFLSELGATHSWVGRPNYASMILFSAALATIGVAMVMFARTWRAFAFDRSRARVFGIASQVAGTLSGCAFVALACCPLDKLLALHNALVVTAFALLLAYSVSLTIVWARNGATALQLVSCAAYVLIVLAYFAVVVYATRLGLATRRSHWLLVGSQKLMAYASMAYVAYLTILIRRKMTGPMSRTDAPGVI